MSVGKLIVISGPGGVGKSTIVDLVRNNSTFYFSVSATTRLPRQGEENGVAYRFISESEFDGMIEGGLFLEWAEFAGARYGTPRAPVMDALNSGKHVLLEIEIQGARQVKASIPTAVMVFIAPPSIEELLERLRSRGTDSPERIAARLNLARSEMAAMGDFDHVLVNHRVEDCVNALLSLATST